MITRWLVAASILAPAYAGAAFAQEQPGLVVPAGGNGVSQRAEISQWVGPVKISIDYHSPAVHRRGVDRTGHIWGELVPYGLFDDGHGPSTATPWRAGANESTTISFSHHVTIGGRDVPAGTYALFLEIGRDGPWSWILSNRSEGWGSYQYDPRDEVMRVPAEPETVPFTEFLSFGFDERRPDGTLAFLQWENKRVPLAISVPDVNALWVAEMRRQLRGWPGFNPESLREAAQFCADHQINLDEALVWADRAIHEPFRGAGIGREDFLTLWTKAAVLEAMGRTAEADRVMETALDLPRTPPVVLFLYGNKLLAAGALDKALRVFNLNQQQHPDEPFWTHLGLARGYTIGGDRTNAIREWEIAIRNIPLSERSDLPEFERALAALRSHR